MPPLIRSQAMVYKIHNWFDLFHTSSIPMIPGTNTVWNYSIHDINLDQEQIPLAWSYTTVYWFYNVTSSVVFNGQYQAFFHLHASHVSPWTALFFLSPILPHPFMGKNLFTIHANQSSVNKLIFSVFFGAVWSVNTCFEGLEKIACSLLQTVCF